ERKDLLCGLFWMLALWTYVRYAQNLEANPNSEIGTAKSSRLALRSFHFPWLALLCFTLALMSKPMAVTLPFVLLLLDYWPLKQFTIYDLRFAIWRLVGEKLPFFALSVIACVLTFSAQQQAIVSTAGLPVSQR